MNEFDTEKEVVHVLIDRLVSLDQTEEEEAQIILLLDRLCPDPEWSKYIFHSDEFYDERSRLDIRAVVNKIFSYKSIIL